MFHGRLRDGRLTDISAREATYPDDVPLDEMPMVVGPMAYDAEARSALALPREGRSVEERLATSGMGPLQAAFALRLSQGWDGLPGSTKSWVVKVIDDAATAASAAIG